MINKMLDLLDEIMPFRASVSYVNDFEIVYSHIEYYERAKSINCANVYLQKYQGILSVMGKVNDDVKLVYDKNIYRSKTDDDVIDDLYFILWGILCEAHIVIGFERSVPDFVFKHIYN